MRRKALKHAFPNTLPVLTGYVFLGISYGILMSTSGFPFWYPILTALIVYTGSMEFLLVSILLSAFNPAATFVTALMVGARHLFYGLSMLSKYKNMGWKKFYLIYTTSDETFAVNYAAEIPEDVDKSWFYFWVSLLDQMYWVTGAAIGGILGGLITFDATGLDFVMTAMFIVIFMDQWMKDRRINVERTVATGKKLGTASLKALRDHIPALIGIFGSLICLLIFGPDNFIIPSMVVILVALLLYRKSYEQDEARTKNLSEDSTQTEKGENP